MGAEQHSAGTPPPGRIPSKSGPSPPTSVGEDKGLVCSCTSAAAPLQVGCGGQRPHHPRLLHLAGGAHGDAGDRAQRGAGEACAVAMVRPRLLKGGAVGCAGHTWLRTTAPCWSPLLLWRCHATRVCVVCRGT